MTEARAGSGATDGAAASADADRAAETYDHMADVYVRAADRSVFNALCERPAVWDCLAPINPGMKVLDVGCGQGLLASKLVAAGARVTGFDVSTKLLEKAHLVVGDRAELFPHDLTAPFSFAADATFHRVVASLVLHYVEDWVGPLSEIRRVLRPDGHLVMSTHHPIQELRDDVSYFDTVLVSSMWELLDGISQEVFYYARPLSAMFDAFADARLKLTRLVEPRPVEPAEGQLIDPDPVLSIRPGLLVLVLSPA